MTLIGMAISASFIRFVVGSTSGAFCADGNADAEAAARFSAGVVLEDAFFSGATSLSKKIRINTRAQRVQRRLTTRDTLIPKNIPGNAPPASPAKIPRSDPANIIVAPRVNPRWRGDIWESIITALNNNPSANRKTAISWSLEPDDAIDAKMDLSAPMSISPAPRLMSRWRSG